MGDLIELNSGETVKFKGTNSKFNFEFEETGHCKFVMEGSISASGDITSLLNGEGGNIKLEEDNTFSGLFYGCESLVSAPNLPSTTLSYQCYSGMFRGCTGLTELPSDLLPAQTLSGWCYYYMFSGCNGLTELPSDLLPAQTLSNYCYSNMFENCRSLVSVPQLPAETLSGSCYHEMFSGCESLVNAPELNATNLSGGCYSGMFRGCTSLVNAPELNATNLSGGCYSSMFRGCTNLSYVKCLANESDWYEDRDEIRDYYYTSSWLHNVSQSGTFVKALGVNWPTGENGIPAEGWTINDYTE